MYKLALIFATFGLISSASANPCPYNLRWNAEANWCETKKMDQLMDFAAMKKTEDGKKKMRAKCDEMADEHSIDQKMWLTPAGDTCAFCVAGKTYDPVSQICK